MRPQRSGSHDAPSEIPWSAEDTSPPPILNPPVPSKLIVGRSAALASSTYRPACSTFVEATRKSGLFVIASPTRASNWESLNVASQLSWILLVEIWAAFHGAVRSKLVRVPDCW